MNDLQKALGQFYFCEHTNNPPTFLQVVGWTPKAESENTLRRYVYVRKVPLKIIPGMNGGQWEFDQNAIEACKKLSEPVKKNVPGLVSGNAILIDGAGFIRYSGMTIPLWT